MSSKKTNKLIEHFISLIESGQYQLPDIQLDTRFQDPEIKYADYDGRKIVKYKCKNGLCGLFYVSAGETDDSVKQKGDVYPIAGVMGRSKSSNKIGKEIMPDVYDDFRYNGWIMKNVAGKTREEALTNSRSYYNQPGLRNISNYYTKYPEKLQALMKPENKLSLDDLMSDVDNEFETNPKYAPRFLYDNAMAAKKERETAPAVKPAMASQQAEPVKESYTIKKLEEAPIYGMDKEDLDSMDMPKLYNFIDKKVLKGTTSMDSLRPADRYFVASRVYDAAEHEDDHTTDIEPDGKFKPGTLIRQGAKLSFNPENSDQSSIDNVYIRKPINSTRRRLVFAESYTEIINNLRRK
jgi:hypothetical protein